jgi:hypothetical protein
MVEIKCGKMDALVKELEELVKKENERIQPIQIKYIELKCKKGLGMKWVPKNHN